MARLTATEINKVLKQAGLSALGTDHSIGVGHILLIPVGPELASIETLSDGSTSWREGEDRLRWASVRAVRKEPGTTVQCLNDFIKLGNASTEDILSFIKRWGLPSLGWSEAPFDAEGYCELGDWRLYARTAHSAYLAIIATEEGRLVPEDVLNDLESWDDFPVLKKAWQRLPWPPDTGKLEPVVREVRLEHWRTERRRVESGLRLQRRIIMNFFNGDDRAMEPFSVAKVPVAIWDEEGRRVSSLAIGAKEIAAAHLWNIFTSQLPDTYICSICGDPYQFIESDGRRRPRSGARRFCSSECRDTGTRERKRASWHIHKWGRNN